MSRLYSIEITVKEPKPDKVDEIKDAARSLWPFDDWTTVGRYHSSSGESSLGGGMSEEEMAESLVKAVWKANGAYCVVKVRAACLEHIPYNDHEFDEDDYDDWVA